VQRPKGRAPSDSAKADPGLAKAGPAKDFEQIRIPEQILFACFQSGFEYPNHIYG
jgi:hypothetical protein